MNLAKLVLTCARKPSHRVLNSADPDTPTAADIVSAIANITSTEIEVRDSGTATGQAGWSPWDTWPPFFLDTGAAAATGYQPAGDYATTVEPVVHELLALTAEQRAALDRDPYFNGPR